MHPRLRQSAARDHAAAGARPDAGDGRARRRRRWSAAAATIQGQGTGAVIVNQSSQKRDHQLEHVQYRRRRDHHLQSAERIVGRAQPRDRRPRAVGDRRHADGERPRLHHQPRRHPVRAQLRASTPRASSPPPTTSATPTSWRGGTISTFRAGRMPRSSTWGTITATSGGFAALVAPGVRNSGTITATLGTVSLASGNAFTLDFYGDRLITLAVNDQIAAKVKDVATGQTAQVAGQQHRQPQRQRRPGRAHRGGRAGGGRFRSSTTTA